MNSSRNIPFATFVTIGLICCGITLRGQVSAPIVNAAASRNQILIGEQVAVKVTAQLPVNVPVTQFFSLPDTFNTLEVVRRSNIDSAVEGGIKIYSQNFVITGFDSGSWRFPPMAIKVAGKDYNSNTIDIHVIPVPLTDSTYHDIREIIEVKVKPTSSWYWVVAVLSVVLLVVLLILWLKSRRKKNGAVAIFTSDPGALQDALHKLKQLESQQLPSNGAFKTYYSTLTDIAKIYMQKKWAVNANSFTTDELLLHSSGHLTKEQTSVLAEILRIADAVKFAKYHPEATWAETDIKRTEDILRQMDRKND